jgi:dTMP kinase
MPLPLANKFIVLDGGEGCGKTTQSRMICAELIARGIPTIAVRDPGATHIGEQIRAVLLNTGNSEMSLRSEMLLYMAARAQLMMQIILPALNAGNCVICDRFVSSTLAYQLGGEDLTSTEIRAVADIAIRGRWPDLTIILDMPLEQSQQRLARPKDRIEQRPLEYHERVRQNFLAQAAADTKRYRVIDAARDPNLVQAEILRAVLQLTA